MNKRFNKVASRLLALSLAVLICSSSMLAHADDISKLEQQTANLQNQLYYLNKELNTLSSEITTLTSQIEDVNNGIAKATLDLTAARLNEELQYSAMKKRIKFMYETGHPSFLEMLCDSKNMSDFLNRTEFVKNVTEYDRKMLAELIEIRDDIEKKEISLKEEQASLLVMQETLDAKSQELNVKIASTANDLKVSSDALANAKAALGGSGNTGDTTPTPGYDVSDSDLVLFAAILQCEAGTSNYDALLAVATVIMNRWESSRYPNTLYGVIYQKGQFSPTWNGSLNRVLSRGPVALCYQVARDALNGSRYAAVQHCYFFNASYTGKPGIVVGGNVFW